MRAILCAVVLAMAGCLQSSPPTAQPTLDQLSTRLSDADPDVRFQARIQLADKGEAAVPNLIAVLENGSLPARQEAAAALSLMGNVPRAGAVSGLTAAVGDPDPGLRLNAIQALRSIGPAAREAVPAIQLALGDDRSDIRAYAFAALADIQGSEAVPVLADHLQDPRTRIYAADALGTIGPAAKPALPALQELAQGEDSGARLAAREAIARITR